MENLQELDEALDAARECGLEGKNKRGAWRCSEIRRRTGAARAKSGSRILRSVARKGRQRGGGLHREGDANEEHKKIRDMIAPYPVRTQMLGKDANYNRYWIFAGVPGVVFKEVQEVEGKRVHLYA